MLYESFSLCYVRRIFFERLFRLTFYKNVHGTLGKMLYERLALNVWTMLCNNVYKMFANIFYTVLAHIGLPHQEFRLAQPQVIYVGPTYKHFSWPNKKLVQLGPHVKNVVGPTTVISCTATYTDCRNITYLFNYRLFFIFITAIACSVNGQLQ